MKAADENWFQLGIDRSWDPRALSNILYRQGRTLSDKELKTLEDLAAIVMNDLEQRVESRHTA